MKETHSWAERAARRIWEDLCDRRGFGLEGLDVDDPELYEDIQDRYVGIIRKEKEAER